MSSDLHRPSLERVDAGATSQAGADAEPTLRLGGRRRRPTGEPPPLPAPQRWRGVRWAMLGLLAASVSLVSFLYVDPSVMAGPDEALGRWVVAQRSGVLIQVAEVLNLLQGSGLVTALRYGVIVVLLLTRRLRHLFVFLSAILLAEWCVEAISQAIQRPRPMVDILTTWQGFSHPSRPMAALTVTVIGALRVLVPHGRLRHRLTSVAGAVLLLVAAARVLLGVEHPTDTLVAMAIAAGWAFALTRLFAPHQRFPVVYRRGQTAHVGLGEERIRAIRQGVADQLGLEVVTVEGHGEVGSAGSTPLRLELRGEAGPTAVFAKLYTDQHLRADRFYKLGRLLLYGRLEDESSFSTIRQLVQHEDYVTRLLRDADVDVPASLGIVEITPEREYLVVFEMRPGEDFDPGAPVSDELLDACLRIVEHLWEAGVAHRDIKPGNILVAGDRPTLVDVAFAQVRPTPWRHAVDLGAMLLMLALANGAERTYAAALRRFTAEEIAEALAAAHGFAVPAQLRDALAAADDDVREQLRALAPKRAEIAAQRWDRRRLWAALVVVSGIVAATSALAAIMDSVGLL